MQAFITQAASSLGIEESTAQAATAKLLSMLQEQGEGSAVGELLAKLPGAEALIASAGSDGGGGGGVAGMLGGLASKVGGDSKMGLLGELAQTGLDPSQLGGLANQFVGYAREEAGPDLVTKALDSAPALKSMLG